MEAVAEQLGAKVEQAPEFFRNTPVVIDLSAIPPGAGDGGVSAPGGAAAGLRHDPLRCARRDQVPECGGGGHGAGDPERHLCPGDQALPPGPPSPSRQWRPRPRPPPPRGAPAPRPPSTLVTRPVRSGSASTPRAATSRWWHPVSSGAELMADGNIHVYGPLRGRAMAGMKGNRRRASSARTCRPSWSRWPATTGSARTSRRAARDAGADLPGPKGPAHRTAVTPAAGALRAPGGPQTFPGDRDPEEDPNLARIIVITSGKGGVGKTTTIRRPGHGAGPAGPPHRRDRLRRGAAQPGPHHGVRAAGGLRLRQRHQQEANLNQALIRDKRCDDLFVLPASQTRDKDALTKEGVGRVLEELSQSFDYVVCDSPAGIEHGATMAMYYADDAVVVTNPEVSSVRDSDRMLGILSSKSKRAETNAEPIREFLLLTRYRPAAGAERRDAERGGRAGDPVAQPARGDPGVQGGAQRLQLRRAGDPGPGERRRPGLRGRGGPLSGGGRAPPLPRGEKKGFFSRLFGG
jgi:septum formation inhibitor MinC/Mrp family chromosome partitioning ATPase